MKPRPRPKRRSTKPWPSEGLSSIVLLITKVITGKSARLYQGRQLENSSFYNEKSDVVNQSGPWKFHGSGSGEIVSAKDYLDQPRIHRTRKHCARSICARTISYQKQG